MSDSRIDELFQKVIDGESIEDFQPISRSEAYLKAALTRSGVEDLPTPISRLDVLLYELAKDIPAKSTKNFLEKRNGDYLFHMRCAQYATNEETMLTSDELVACIESIDFSVITSLVNAFSYCDAWTHVPKFDMRNVTNASWMFAYCNCLSSIPELDMRNVTNASCMFYYCYSLTDIHIKNIKTDLNIGDSEDITRDSLIHLIRELRNTGSNKTLYMGPSNLTKLANVYVKTVTITDAMRKEDDLIDEKLPFEVCESTDDGAMLITEYASKKNWTLS